MQGNAEAAVAPPFTDMRLVSKVGGFLNYGKAAEWHSLPASMGVTANFFAVTCEKMRHEGGQSPL